MNPQHYSQPGSYPGVPSGGAPAAPPGHYPGAPDPGQPQKPKRDLFAMLDGIPANLMIVLGLFLLLIGLTVPGCRRAYASSVEADWRLASALMEHDLAQFRQAQEREREAERAAAAANPAAPPDIATNEARRAAALTAEEQRLEREHDVADKRRDALEAAASVEGLWAHRVFEWLGRLLLLLGLIVVTSQAEGLRQKVFLVITVIVLLTSISGLDLDFDLGTRVNTEQERPAASAFERGG